VTTVRPLTQRPLARIVVAGFVIALAGCAAQRAYRQGQDLIASGHPTEGLAQLAQASQLEPGSAQYRIAYLQARDARAQALLDRAEQARTKSDFDAAEAAYKDVLAIRPADDRALTGLRQLDRQRRIEAWFKQAELATAKRELDAARAKLHAIANERPGYPPAVALLRRIDELSAKPALEIALSSSYRKSISIEFKDAPLRTVFEVISRTSGLNFVFDKDVRTDQKTSIFLKNSTIEAAVGLTLLTNQLAQRVLDANSVLIYPNTVAKQKEYQPLTVKSFYLGSAEAKNVANTLKQILKVHDIVVDDKLNLLIVRDSAEVIQLAEKLIAVHDVPDPEVMLDVEVLEVNRTRLLDLGVRWPDQLSLTPLASGTGGLTVSDLRHLNASRIGASIGNVTLNAKKQDTDANLLANPRIRTRNREKARILIGEKVPNITTTLTSTGFASDSVTYVDVGLKLDVEPTVYPDGEVAIKIGMEVSTITDQVQTKSGTLAYRIGTRNAQTVLRLKDGENQVLAGLINDEDRKAAYKVPALGEVPLVGRLFGSQSDDAIKTEIVLSITPRILRNVVRPDAGAMEFESGTDASVGSRLMISSSGAVAAAPEVRPASAAAPSRNAPQASPSTGPQLQWRGPNEVKAGGNMTVELVLQSSAPLSSSPIAIGFDPSALQVVSVTEGDFFRQGGAVTRFETNAEGGGLVKLKVARADGSAIAGQASVATLHLRALAPGQTQLQVLSADAGGATSAVQTPAPLQLTIAP
jgi:general secretion pathway protein D